jgi:hypothetical protein
MALINGRVSGGGRGEENGRLAASISRRNGPRGGEGTRPTQSGAWHRARRWHAERRKKRHGARGGTTRKRERGEGWRAAGWLGPSGPNSARV